MTKKDIHMLVPFEVHKRYEKVVGKGNVTSSFIDYMERTINFQENNSDDINIELEKMERDKILKQVNQLSAQLRQKENIITDFEENMLKKKEEMLKQEAEVAEKAKRCINCGTMNSGKWHEFAKGKVCNSCFHTADDFKRWM